MPQQHPEDHFGRSLVEIPLIRAVRAHAPCTHRRDRLRRRHRRADRHEPAAQRAHLAAHTLHTHAYAGLIRPREKARETRIFGTSSSTNPLVTALCIRKRTLRNRQTGGGGTVQAHAVSPLCPQDRRSVGNAYADAEHVAYSIDAARSVIARENSTKGQVNPKISVWNRNTDGACSNGFDSLLVHHDLRVRSRRSATVSTQRNPQSGSSRTTLMPVFHSNHLVRVRSNT